MGKSVLVGVLGLLAVVVGLSVATWIGPDDWVDGPAAVVNGGGEVAVATNYGLLSRSFPMRVSASTPDAEVFVGIAHVIDADDYLADTTTAQIHWFSPEGVRAEQRTSANAALPAPPVGLDFWRTWASGDGVQSVEGDFRGQPVVAVVTTANGTPAPLSVQLASRFVGAFAAALGLAGLGMTLLLLAGWWHWRRHRRVEVEGETFVDDSPTSFTHDGPTAGGQASGVVSTTGLTALILSVTLGATGCTVPLPFTATDLPPRDQVTRDALDGLDLVALAADYDRRNNPAIAAAAAPTYSAREWAAADAELTLAGDRFTTAWNRVKKKVKKPSPCRTKLGGPYPSVAPNGYPLSILVTYGMTCEPGAEPELSTVSVFTKDRSFSPWRQAAGVAPDPTTPPAPGAQAPLSADAAQAAAAANQFIGFLEGRATTLAIPAAATKWRSDYLKPRTWMTMKWSVSALPGGIRVGRTEKGSIALASIVVVATATAKSGESIYWQDPWDDIYQQPGDHHTLSKKIAVEVLVQLEGGQATVLGWQRGDYLD